MILGSDVRGDFEYLFERAKPAFEPIFDREQEVKAQGDFAHRFEALELVPPEHLPWYRVTGLRRREEPDEKEGYLAALKRLSPEAGAFILMSLRRRSRE